MNCPTCSKECVAETYEGVSLDVCPGCRGIWLDKGELEALTKRREKIFKPQEVDAVNRLCGASGVSKEAESRDLACPKCSASPMKTLNYNYSSGIVVDRCAKGCGLWFDADELEKVQIHAELWQDKLEANNERFTLLASQVEKDAPTQYDNLGNAADPNRYRFVSSLVRGLIKFG